MGVEHRKIGWADQAVDWQERLNVNRLRAERTARTRDAMKKNGIAAAILAGNDMRYATSIMGAQGQFEAGSGECAIFFADYPDDTIVYVGGDVAAQHRKNCTWIKPENMRWAYRLMQDLPPEAQQSEAKKWAARIKQDLKEKKLEKEKIAAVAMTELIRNALAAEGIKTVPASSFMRGVRAIKTVDELTCLKISGAVGDQLFWKMYENLRPGVRESYVNAEMLAEWCRTAPVSMYRAPLRSGPNGAPNYVSLAPTDRIIQPGDLVHCDVVGPICCGYRTCYVRTFKVGTKANEEEKDWYKNALDWLMTAEENIKPGVSSADIAKLWPAYKDYAKWGVMLNDERDLYANNCGHGIGLAQLESPDIHRATSFDFPVTLEKGMVIALETWCGKLGVNGVRLEDVGVVTATGFEILQGEWPIDELVTPRHSMVAGWD